MSTAKNALVLGLSKARKRMYMGLTLILQKSGALAPVLKMVRLKMRSMAALNAQRLQALLRVQMIMFGRLPILNFALKTALLPAFHGTEERS